MARRKGTELSVFKGREAKLNHAIFQVLTLKEPEIIYDIYKNIRRMKGLKHTKYTNINRRVKALAVSGYLSRTGVRDTQAGTLAILYGLSTKARIAILLDRISPDLLLSEADEEVLIAELSVLRLFFARISK